MIKVNIKRGTSFTLLQSEIIFQNLKKKKQNGKNLTFAWLGAVVFTEGFVFGNIRIEVLQRVFGNVLSHNNLVVSKDVSKRQSGQPAFVIRFHRMESHFSW